MDITAIGAFWLVAFLLIVAPGADWAFTLSAAMRGNAVVPAVAGLVAGYAVMTMVVSAGVGAPVAGSRAALTVITLVGGAYLVWLGIATLRHPAQPLAAGDATPHSNRGTFARGIGVSGLNPKGLLIFVALLPQFTNPNRPWPVGVQMAVLGWRSSPPARRSTSPWATSPAASSRPGPRLPAPSTACPGPA